MNTETDWKLEAEKWKLIAKDTEKKLKMTETHLELATDGYWVWDLNNPDYELMSDGFWKHLGYDPKTKKSSPSEWISIVHPDDLENAKEVLEHHLSTGSEYKIVSRYMKPNGKWTRVICRGESFKSNGDHFLLGAHQGVDDLYRIMEELERFAYSVSHDFQEPLRSVIGFISLLRDSLSEDITEDQQRYLDSASNGAQRMVRMLEHVLEYSRISSLRTTEDVNIKYAVDEAISNLSASIKISNADIIINIPESCIIKESIHEHMVRIIQNIVHNSIKYKDDNRRLEIKISVDILSNSTKLIIKDNGVGVDLNLGDPFQMFRRLNPEKPGEGVGLSITKALVEHSNGDITIDSTPGNGACVTILFDRPVYK